MIVDGYILGPLREQVQSQSVVLCSRITLPVKRYFIITNEQDKGYWGAVASSKLPVRNCGGTDNTSPNKSNGVKV